MKPITFFAIALGSISGVAFTYIVKCKQLEHKNKEQSDEIRRLKNYIMEEILI